ncbi:MAG: 30S ribosomal protein S19e [Desulfurococcales archaeon ex4484_217_1]|nr:MAG: 30S ribosomal protein S19e [Desulfurococcales archaeon ex4484_217_1]
MVSAIQVPADRLIAELAKYLKEKVPQVKHPEWASYVKTGAHKERVPSDPDWWYYRCASILRKLYVRVEPVGIESLRVAYGGRKNYGVAPEHFVRGSGSIVRKALQQLEKAGLVVKVPRKGRTLSPKGRSLLDKLANKIMRELVKENKELEKYLK